MTPFARTLALAAAVLALGTLASPGEAVAGGRGAGRGDGDLVALTGDRTLLLVNSRRGRVVRRVDVTNVAGRILGIDVRPANGLLYGLVNNGQVVTIDPSTGVATPRSTLRTTAGNLTLPSGEVSVDFNPVVDRLRIVAANGTNLRANVDDGLTTVDPSINFGASNPFGGSGTPAVVGVAYSNSRGTPASTLLYDIETSTDALYLQQPPNDGTLVPVGRLGVAVDDAIGFDIATDRRGNNLGIVVDGDRLLEVDLAGGAVVFGFRVRDAAGDLRDVAALIR